MRSGDRALLDAGGGWAAIDEDHSVRTLYVLWLFTPPEKFTRDCNIDNVYGYTLRREKETQREGITSEAERDEEKRTLNWI